MSLITTAPSYTAGQILTAGQLNGLQDGIQAPWDFYAPAWTGSVTNPTIGNGTLGGRYLRVGKTVDFYVQMIAGSTTTFGSGAFGLSLPFAPAFTGVFVVPFGVRIRIGTNVYEGDAYTVTGSTLGLAVDAGSAGGVLSAAGPTIPAAFASGSSIIVAGRYEVP